MKIRNGFVSNSSSSSFIIEIKEAFGLKQGELITDEQKDKLINYGFKYTHYCAPCFIEWNKEWEADEETDILAFSVICNENDVLYFLIENDIPFKALTHYGHLSVIWNGINEIKQIRNPGIEMVMHERSYCEDEPIYREFTKNKWLEEHSWLAS